MNLQNEILALSLAYAALGVLLLIAVTWTRLPWRSKAAAIAATSAFYVIVFFRLQGLLGWSAHEALPARFELLWAQVVEADPAADQEGAIHLWVEELNDANVPSRKPRAYVLPYSAALADKVEAAKSEITHGHHQVGRPTDFGVGGGQEVTGNVAPRPGGSPGVDPSGGGLLDAKFLGGGAHSIEFAPLPPPALPPKDAP